MNDEELKEYYQCLYDAIDGCICHLSIALQELGNYHNFENLKYDIQMIFEEAKRIKCEVEEKC